MSGGEKQGDRAVMETLIRDQRLAGISSSKAEAGARKAMIEVDRRLRDQGKR